MSEKISNSPITSPPRFVFRTFGHHFSKCHKQMAQLSVPVPEDLRERIFDEIYLISNLVEEYNVKIKSNKLDIKRLVLSKGNLEQWRTVSKQGFPITKNILIDNIFPILKADLPVLPSIEFNEKQFVSIVKRHTDLHVVPIQKKRNTYIVNYTICEFAEVIIGNDYLFTVSVESADMNEVISTIQELNLESYENINYIEAIKRSIDITHKPFAN